MATTAEKYKFSEVLEDGRSIITELLEQCKVHRVEEVKMENVMRVGNKDVVATQLVRALALIERHHSLIISQQAHVGELQEEVIKLQRDLIIEQRTQVTAIRRGICEEVVEIVEEAVKEGVQDSLNESVKSYSDAVKSGSAQSSSSGGSVFSQETLKKVVKQVAVEEELSRNIMVFGLPEEENDGELDTSVSQVFQHLGEKPRFEAVRLGKKKESAVRPVRVVLSSAHSAQSVLVKSRNLRHADKYKRVFLSPDRTVEERERQRGLVQQLKKKMEEEPQSKHYIKHGQIVSVASDST